MLENKLHEKPMWERERETLDKKREYVYIVQREYKVQRS